MNKITYEMILPLVSHIDVTDTSISCHFICPKKNKEIISTVPIEPILVQHKISMLNFFLHPIQSWKLKHHKRTTIYGEDSENSLVLKSFYKISNKFTWNTKYNSFICL